jgi:hypothetical protein
MGLGGAFCSLICLRKRSAQLRQLAENLKSCNQRGEGENLLQKAQKYQLQVDKLRQVMMVLRCLARNLIPR